MLSYGAATVHGTASEKYSISVHIVFSFRCPLAGGNCVTGGKGREVLQCSRVKRFRSVEILVLSFHLLTRSDPFN